MSDRISEHDVVIFTGDVPDEGLKAGDVGVVLLTHAGHDEVPPGYTVEVTTLFGETIAVVDVAANLVRPVSEGNVRHTRSATLRT